MAKHIATGKQGEVLARAFLENKGWTILETNWRYSRAEVDIIGKDGDCLVFVEVKTRSNDKFGHPVVFVTSEKEALVVEAAQVYMENAAHEGEFRFDIVSVLLTPGRDPMMEHFPDAFFPGF